MGSNPTLSAKRSTLRTTLHYDGERKAAEAAWLEVVDPTVLSMPAGVLGGLVAVLDAAAAISWNGAPLTPPTWHPPAEVEAGATGSDTTSSAAADEVGALEGWRRYRPAGTSGIAWWKVSLNGLWVVTRPSAARPWRPGDRSRRLVRRRSPSMSSMGDASHLRDWLAFLRLAADGEGFRLE